MSSEDQGRTQGSREGVSEEMEGSPSTPEAQAVCRLRGGLYREGISSPMRRVSDGQILQATSRGGRRAGMSLARPVRMAGRSKYSAQPTVVDGIRFASKRGAERHGDLSGLEKAGRSPPLALP